jgi:DNA end-binding protein Ku
MARAIWSGAVSFGLVNVPIKVYPAVRDHTVHFHQVDKATGSRIRYEKVAETTGKEVSSDDLALGYEMDKGKLVVVDPDELAALRPRTTRTIDITDFVDLAEVDPVYYNRTHWLAPDGEAAGRAYRLLVSAMADRAKVGIGMVVMRNKQYLAAIRPREGALALSTMRFADEVLDRASVADSLGHGNGSKAPANELRLATQIIDSLTSGWDPAKYHDTYTNEVQTLIKSHEKGQDVVVDEAPAAKADDVTDLMQALQASLDAARSAKGNKLAKAVEQAAEELVDGAAREGKSTSKTGPSRSSARRTGNGTARSKSGRPPTRRSDSRKSA